MLLIYGRGRNIHLFYGLPTHPLLILPKPGMLMEYDKLSLISFLEKQNTFPGREIVHQFQVSSSNYLQHFVSSKIYLRLCFAPVSFCTSLLMNSLLSVYFYFLIPFLFFFLFLQIYWVSLIRFCFIPLTVEFEYLPMC